MLREVPGGARADRRELAQVLRDAVEAAVARDVIVPRAMLVGPGLQVQCLMTCHWGRVLETRHCCRSIVIRPMVRLLALRCLCARGEKRREGVPG